MAKDVLARIANGGDPAAERGEAKAKASEPDSSARQHSIQRAIWRHVRGAAIVRRRGRHPMPLEAACAIRAASAQRIDGFGVVEPIRRIK